MTFRLLTQEEKDEIVRTNRKRDGFLGNPCACGWSQTEIDERTRQCEWCGSKYVLREGYWSCENDGGRRRLDGNEP